MIEYNKKKTKKKPARISILFPAFFEVNINAAVLWNFLKDYKLQSHLFLLRLSSGG